MFGAGFWTAVGFACSAAFVAWVAGAISGWQRGERKGLSEGHDNGRRSERELWQQYLVQVKLADYYLEPGSTCVHFRMKHEVLKDVDGPGLPCDDQMFKVWR